MKKASFLLLICMCMVFVNALSREIPPPSQQPEPPSPPQSQPSDPPSPPPSQSPEPSSPPPHHQHKHKHKHKPKSPPHQHKHHPPATPPSFNDTPPPPPPVNNKPSSPQPSPSSNQQHPPPIQNKSPPSPPKGRDINPIEKRDPKNCETAFTSVEGCVHDLIIAYFEDRIQIRSLCCERVISLSDGCFDVAFTQFSHPRFRSRVRHYCADN